MDHSDHKKAEVQISSDVSICVFNALIIMDLAVHWADTLPRNIAFAVNSPY